MHVRSLQVSLPAYLAMEAAETEHRHEYWDGEVWAMTGTTLAHNDLVLALVSRLRAALAGSPCRAFAESIRTRISDSKYVYPDIVVACPPRMDESARPPTLTNPRVVFEVLSESTASFDRGDKLDAYRRVETIEEIVLVDASTRELTDHRRQADGAWLVRTLTNEDALELGGLDVRLELSEVFGEIG